MEHKNTATPNQQEEVTVPLLISVEEMIEQSIGRLNLIQIFQAIFASLSPFLDVFSTFISIFVDAQPKWHCTSTYNTTSCIPDKSDICSLSKNEWAWDNNVHTTIISEWDLECASSFVTSFPLTCYFMGCLLGGLVLSTLGDSSLGRKNLLCISTMTMSLTALFSAFAANIWVYSLVRFLCGVGRAPLAMSAVVLTFERVGKRWRSQAVMVAYILFSFGLLALTGIAYLFKESSWRTLYVWTSIPGIIYAILAYFFMYESPRWLLTQGREKDAMDVLTSLGRLTSSQISPSSPVMIPYTQQKLTDDSNGNPFAAFKILISRRWAIKRLIASMLLSFGIGLMYFGLFLGLGDLGSDIYLTLLIHALLSMASFLLAILFWIPKCKRRISLLGFCTLGGATCLIFSIQAASCHKVQGLLLGMELVAMFCACMASCIVTIYVVELFPTCVRSSTSSLVRQAMILGSVFDPILVLLGNGNLLYSHGVFGSAMLLCGFWVLCLPETKDKVHCDTMEEQERASGQ